MNRGEITGEITGGKLRGDHRGKSPGGNHRGNSPTSSKSSVAWWSWTHTDFCHTHLSMHACTYVDLRTYVWHTYGIRMAYVWHTYACMHVCMYACMHVCMYVCMHISILCIYIHWGACMQSLWMLNYYINLQNRNKHSNDLTSYM